MQVKMHEKTMVKMEKNREQIIKGKYLNKWDRNKVMIIVNEEMNKAKIIECL